MLSLGRRLVRLWTFMGRRLVLAGLLALMASLSSASAAPTPVPGPNPNDPRTMAATAEAQARQQAWETRLAAAENPAVVSASRTLYGNETVSQALSTAESAFPGWLTGAVFGGPPLAAGEHVSSYVNAHEAEVSGPGGARAALLSTLPLLGQTPSGVQAPIDLSLQDVGGAFEPASSAAPVTIPSSSQGEVRFLNQGFGLSLVGSGDQPGRSAHDRRFYANMDTDTDAVIAPVQTGVEVSWVLRSASSPEDQTLRFDLPSGATLVLDGSAGGPQQVRIVASDGSLLGFVFPPAAVDAAGKPVPASYALDGRDRLVMHIGHQAGSYLYPILADPLVAAWNPGMYASWSQGYCTCDASGEFSWGGDSGSYTFTDGPSTIGQGANGQWGEWYYNSVSGAYIYEEYSNSVWHFPNNSDETGGIWDNSTHYWASGSWADSVPSNGSGPGGSGSSNAFRSQTAQESYVDSNYCAGSQIPTGGYGTCPIPPHNGAVHPSNLGVTAALSLLGPIGSGYIPKSAVYGDYLFESDDITPTLSGVSMSGFTSGQWTNATSGYVNATGTVSTGLGMAAIDVTSPLVTGTYRASNSCSSYPCPLTQSSSVSVYYLPTGANNLTVQAVDEGGNTSATQSAGTACSDSLAPSIQASGTLWRPAEGVVLAGQQTLDVQATDGTPDNNAADQQSGVQSIQVQAVSSSSGQTVYDSGVLANTTAAVNEDGCGPSDAPESQQLVVDTTSWTPGQYTLSVIGTDNVGNVTIEKETITVTSPGSASQTVQDAVQTVANAAAPIVQTITSTASPVVQTVASAVAPIVQPAVATAQSILQTGCDSTGGCPEDPFTGLALQTAENVADTANQQVPSVPDTVPQAAASRAVSCYSPQFGPHCANIISFSPGVPMLGEQMNITPYCMRTIPNNFVDQEMWFYFSNLGPLQRWIESGTTIGVAYNGATYTAPTYFVAWQLHSKWYRDKAVAGYHETESLATPTGQSFPDSIYYLGNGTWQAFNPGFAKLTNPAYISGAPSHGDLLYAGIESTYSGNSARGSVDHLQYQTSQGWQNGWKSRAGVAVWEHTPQIGNAVTGRWDSMFNSGHWGLHTC
jgi:hypothetical protein